MTAAPSTDCLFCQIVAGHRPAEIVFESKSAVAFLDRFPVARGHTLVVPRRHAPTALELDEGATGGLFAAVVEVLDRLQSALHPLGFNVGWNHGAAAGQHVFHLHVHLMPRFERGGGGVQAVGEGVQGADLVQLAGLIRGAPPRGEITPRERLVGAAGARAWELTHRSGPSGRGRSGR